MSQVRTWCLYVLCGGNSERNVTPHDIVCALTLYMRKSALREHYVQFMHGQCSAPVYSWEMWKGESYFFILHEVYRCGSGGGREGCMPPFHWQKRWKGCAPHAPPLTKILIHAPPPFFKILDLPLVYLYSDAEICHGFHMRTWKCPSYPEFLNVKFHLYIPLHFISMSEPILTLLGARPCSDAIKTWSEKWNDVLGENFHLL